MAPLTTEDQFTFLLSCIRHSNAGKVDFDPVAKECDIVTKGAAAKRYERLMKAHGISPTADRSGPTVSDKPATQSKRKANAETKSNSSKKRKVDRAAEKNDDDTADEEHAVKAENGASDASEA